MRNISKMLRNNNRFSLSSLGFVVGGAAMCSLLPVSARADFAYLQPSRNMGIEQEGILESSGILYDHSNSIPQSTSPGSYSNSLQIGQDPGSGAGSFASTSQTSSINISPTAISATGTFNASGIVNSTGATGDSRQTHSAFGMSDLNVAFTVPWNETYTYSISGTIAIQASVSGADPFLESSGSGGAFASIAPDVEAFPPPIAALVQPTFALNPIGNNVTSGQASATSNVSGILGPGDYLLRASCGAQLSSAANGRLVASASITNLSAAVQFSHLITNQTSVGSDQYAAVNGAPGQTGGINAAFSNVSTAGTLAVQYKDGYADADLQAAQYPDLPEGIQLGDGLFAQFWEVQFSGTFSGMTDLTFHYDPDALPQGATSAELFHLVNGTWQEQKVSLDPNTDTFSIETSSFSPFVLTEAPEPSSVGLILTGCAGVLLRRRGGRCTPIR